MEAEPAPTEWRELARAVSQSSSTDQLLSETLPVLRSLAGASTVLVACRQQESWTVDRVEGEPLPAAGLVESLRERPTSVTAVEPPADWPPGVTAVCHPLPGGVTCLLVVWRDRPAHSSQIAIDLLVAGLGRLDAEERYDDLASRVDNAQMLANMGDYDWHIVSDTNRWSDQLFRIYGHEPQAFDVSYESFLGQIHPDDQDWIKQLHERAYATGEPYAMTERIVRPDGEVRYLSSNGQVIMGPDGRPVRMRGTCIDITDRVLAEQERQRSAARFRNLVESSPDAILVMDVTGDVVQANGRAHELLGGDPVGHALVAMVPAGTDRRDGAVEGRGVDGRSLLLDVTMADLSHMEGDGEVAAFLHDARPRLHNESLAAAVREGQLRRRQAMEINDNVVQGLSTAIYALHDGEVEQAGSVLDRTLHAARQMMNDLLEPVDGEEIGPGDLVRSAPSRLDGATA